ncbi:hypothetical protein RJD24_18535 [Bacillaceae bacterium IKA-2]|nr:hypothetical protein RJD24_18535 [Bacillaceae bacterium IKA-2]
MRTKQSFENDFYCVEKDENGWMKFEPKFVTSEKTEKIFFETEDKTLVIGKYAGEATQSEDVLEQAFEGGYYIPQESEFRRRVAGDWAHDPLNKNRPGMRQLTIIR